MPEENKGLLGVLCEMPELSESKQKSCHADKPVGKGEVAVLLDPLRAIWSLTHLD